MKHRPVPINTTSRQAVVESAGLCRVQTRSVLTSMARHLRPDVPGLDSGSPETVGEAAYEVRGAFGLLPVYRLTQAEAPAHLEVSEPGRTRNEAPQWQDAGDVTVNLNKVPQWQDAQDVTMNLAPEWRDATDVELNQPPQWQDAGDVTAST